MPSHARKLSKPATFMKVLFILPNVAVGGVERVRLTLIEQFVIDSIECRLALRECKGELIERARALAPVHELAPGGMHQFIPELIRLIKLEQPTHIVTAFSDIAVLTWIAMRLARSPAYWVHSVHNTHSMAGSRPGKWGRLRYRLENRMAGFAYRHANAVITVSEGVRQEILNGYQVDPTRVTTIYNPVVPDDHFHWKRSPRPYQSECYRIATIGRLVFQKGFDVLIRAMARIPGLWQLDIWGEGPERTNLEAIINEEGLQGRVRLRGYTSNPYSILRETDLFVMPSRHEGLGATLIEAIACQCQVVATDCPHGPREILKDGQIGQLVPVDDIDALINAIARAVSGEHHIPHELLRERAQDFLRSALCLRWESVLMGLKV